VGDTQEKARCAASVPVMKAHSEQSCDTVPSHALNVGAVFVAAKFSHGQAILMLMYHYIYELLIYSW
jgi:hypothetical protein